MENPPPPLPVDYAHPETNRRVAPILSARIAIHTWAIAGAYLVTTIFAIPKLEQVFKDFRIELPAITQITLFFSRLISNNYGWIPILILALVAPFGLSTLLGLGEPTREEVKRRETWICRGLRAIALLVILWMALAMIVPYTTLIQTMTGPSGKR